MAQFLNSHDSWLLSVKNAIDGGYSIPVPENSPAMTWEERDLWQTHVKQTVEGCQGVPPTPAEWMRDRNANSAPSRQQLWDDIAAIRSAAAKGGVP